MFVFSWCLPSTQGTIAGSSVAGKAGRPSTTRLPRPGRARSRTTMETRRKGSNPRWIRTTAAAYSGTNTTEVAAIRPIAPSDPVAPIKDGNPPISPADIQPARADATANFQITSMTDPISRPAGRPAYQSAGIVRIQYETTQAAATPTGPQ